MSLKKEPIRYLNRLTKKEEKENVYGEFFLQVLYGKKWIFKFFSFFFLPLFTRFSFFSRLYGAFQKSRWSRFKIRPFIKKFHIDENEFLVPADSFYSFNDFFIRKLKSSCRPIVNGHDIAILPADGRFLVYPHMHEVKGFWVKGENFSLEKLLEDSLLAHKYSQGAMLLARLAPVDYHRFHFPCNCVPEKSKRINGHLFSVNPMALKRNIHILTQNKRVITPLLTKNFGTILYIEIGATHVGSICQTFIPGEPYAKGDEKGYFSFGGSCLILLFEPARIQFDQDLLEASYRQIETKALMGQSLGRSLSPL
jgi:phosphatidylserine decarboxylase